MNWGKYCGLVRLIVNRYGGEYRYIPSGKTYDPGQMLCVLTYGEDWMKSKEWTEDNEAADAPSRAVAIAEEILREGLPESIEIA